MARKGMRQDARTQDTQVTLARVQGYHEGRGYSQEAYAFRGFKNNWLYTSDRKKPLDENFNRLDGKPMNGYGLEIETTCTGITRETVLAQVYEKIIFPEFPADLFKMQHDGSLGGNTSAECITQVMTQQAVRNMYPAFKKMYDHYFPGFAIRCDDSCGMHTNISLACFGSKPETQEQAVRKLAYFINTHYTLCCGLFRRNPNRTHYCSVMRQYQSMDYCKTFDIHSVYSDHGVCLNLGHYDAGRVEIRLVGGQGKFAEFRNTMETIFFLVGRLSRIAWKDIDNLEKVFNGCNQYVYDRLTKCRTEGTLAQSVVDAVEPTVTRETLM